jgi:hypothetical protein
MREFRHAYPISRIKGQGVLGLVVRKEKTMQSNRSRLAAVALTAAIVLGLPAFAKSMQSGKVKIVTNQSTRGVKAERARALNAYGPSRRSPTFGVPKPNSPALTGGGGTTYNANLYVY